MVRVTGLEPAHLTAQEPKSCVSANFTTPAYHLTLYHTYLILSIIKYLFFVNLKIFSVLLRIW